MFAWFFLFQAIGARCDNGHVSAMASTCKNAEVRCCGILTVDRHCRLRARQVCAFPGGLPERYRLYTCGVSSSDVAAEMPRRLYNKSLTCRMFAVYNVAGASKKGLYCKKHAEERMVNVHSKSCSNESCTRRATYNVDGIKTPAYCKQHANDSMVNVRNKRCLHESCIKQSYYNASTTTAYCKLHMDTGMVDVRNRHCLRDPCRTQRSLGAEGSNKPEFCKIHAEFGMVNIRSRRRAALVSRRRGTARGVPANVAATAGTRHEDGIFDDSGMNSKPPFGVDGGMLDGWAVNSDSSYGVADVRKRSRMELDGKQHPYCLDNGEYMDGIRQAMEMDPSEDVHGTSSSHSLQRHLNDDTTGATTKQISLEVRRGLVPVPDEHHSGHQAEHHAKHESGEVIKTEMRLAL